MKYINYISMLFMTAILFSCAKKEDVTDKVPGVWETDWTDVLDGDLDDITVNEKIAFDSDGSFSQLFSGTVKFDDWENESEVSYLVAVEGRWEVEDADNIVLHYDMNQFATEIGKSDIEADYTDAAIGLLTGDMGDVFTGLLKSGNTDRLNKKVEAEVEKQITRYFKDMFHEINKDREAFTNVEIHGNTMSADVNHGFFGREAVYDKLDTSSYSNAQTYSGGSENGVYNESSAFEFTGKIGKYPIEMYIDIKNINNYDYSRVEGKYRYTKSGSGSYLTLSGVKRGDTMELTEYNDKGEVTGRFEGTLQIFGRLASMEYTGTFTNYQGKTFSFSLRYN